MHNTKDRGVNGMINDFNNSKDKKPTVSELARAFSKGTGRLSETDTIMLEVYERTGKLPMTSDIFIEMRKRQSPKDGHSTASVVVMLTLLASIPVFLLFEPLVAMYIITAIGFVFMLIGCAASTEYQSSIVNQIGDPNTDRFAARATAVHYNADGQREKMYFYDGVQL
jgi:hypothetical protein